ncbi:MAG: hypothetical protein AAF899_19370, partial [Pseudomonadota bacterium]
MASDRFVPPPEHQGWLMTVVVESDPEAGYGAGEPAWLMDGDGRAFARALVVGRTDGMTPGIQALTLFQPEETGVPAALRKAG